MTIVVTDTPVWKTAQDAWSRADHGGVTNDPLAAAEARWRRDEVVSLVAALRTSPAAGASGAELRALLDELEDLDHAAAELA